MFFSTSRRRNSGREGGRRTNLRSARSRPRRRRFSLRMGNPSTPDRRLPKTCSDLSETCTGEKGASVSLSLLHWATRWHVHDHSEWSQKLRRVLTLLLRLHKLTGLSRATWETL